MWGNVLTSPADLSLASAVFGRKRPRDASCSSLRPPSNLSSSRDLRSQTLSYPQDQPTPFFELNSLSTVSSQIRQNYSTEVEAAVNRLVNITSVGLLHLPLSGLLFRHAPMWLWRAWATHSANRPKRCTRAPNVS